MQSGTTVIYETSPAITVFIMGWLFRNEARYRNTGWIIYLAFALAIVGIAVVVLSERVALGAVLGQSSQTEPSSFALGVALATVAAILGGLSAFGFRWAVAFARDLPSAGSRSRASREIFGTMAGLALSGLFAVPFMAGITIYRSETADIATLPWAILVFPAVNVAATLSWRQGNLLTRRLGVNVILYFTPLLSLGILMAFEQVGAVNLALLFVGAGVIALANLLVFVHDLKSESLRKEGAPELETARAPRH